MNTLLGLCIAILLVFNCVKGHMYKLIYILIREFLFLGFVIMYIILWNSAM